MKVIHKMDLMILLPMLNDVQSLDSDTFNNILDRFGDDYFFEGGEFECTKINAEMAEIRKRSMGNVKYENE